MEELWDVPLSNNQNKCIKTDNNLKTTIREQLLDFLRNNEEIFAWTHNDMMGINIEVMSHRLNIDLNQKSVRQKMRSMNAEHYAALKK